MIQFPKQGEYLLFNSTLNGLGSNSINHQTAKLDLRYYDNLSGKFFYKLRLLSRLTFGNKVPLYDYSIIGVDEKIRGSFFKRIEDRNLFISSFEIFYPIIKQFHLDLTFIPIIPDKLLSYRIALFFHSYIDYGTVFRELLNRQQSIYGYGFGISFLILPYNVIRFELGFDKKFNKEIIFDLGTSL